MIDHSHSKPLKICMAFLTFSFYSTWGHKVIMESYSWKFLYLQNFFFDFCTWLKIFLCLLQWPLWFAVWWRRAAVCLVYKRLVWLQNQSECLTVLHFTSNFVTFGKLDDWQPVGGSSRSRKSSTWMTSQECPQLHSFMFCCVCQTRRMSQCRGLRQCKIK